MFCPIGMETQRLRCSSLGVRSAQGRPAQPTVSGARQLVIVLVRAAFEDCSHRLTQLRLAFLLPCAAASGLRSFELGGVLTIGAPIENLVGRPARGKFASRASSDHRHSAGARAFAGGLSQAPSTACRVRTGAMPLSL